MAPGKMAMQAATSAASVNVASRLTFPILRTLIYLFSYLFINNQSKNTVYKIAQFKLDNTAKRCGIMAVIHITYYDV